ncbi:hypothetical protein [Paraburkholderia nodosa]|uniref:hypothetical protein n=1 Tax=Paraburkholderia nodosa TaxID=392320 RepID=UPI0004831536|nr:hypothetical protein [Paraburkholderia nodosa]
MADDLEFESDGVFGSASRAPLITVFGEVHAAQAGEGAIGEIVIEPALDALAFLLWVTFLGDDFALVAFQRLAEGCALRLGSVDESTSVHFGLCTPRPLLRVLLGIECTIDGLVPASADFCSPEGSALTDVGHSRLHAKD